MTKLDDVAPLRYQAPGIRSDKKIGELNWREMVPAMEELQRLKKKASWSQDELTIELGDGNRPVALVGMDVLILDDGIRRSPPCGCAVSQETLLSTRRFIEVPQGL